MATNVMLKSSVQFVGLLLFLSVLVGNGSCQPMLEKKDVTKIKGMSWVGPPREVGDSSFRDLQRIHTNWVAIMPFGFAYPNQAELHYDSNRQWWGERPDGVLKSIEMAKALGLKVMLKPQIWLMQGSYTGHFELASEKEWQEWEQQYTDYVLPFAHMADSLGVEMLCIGTEWDRFVDARPVYWKELIGKIRAVYAGKLTYAANWDEYKDFPHWPLLDYVGVDAYFPLSEAENPSLDELKSGWQKWNTELQAVSRKAKKPILFTEWGYRSIDYCAHSPWDSSVDHPFSETAQATAYQAVFETVWQEKWMAGGFVWKWFPGNNKRWLSEENTRFTPQGKAAEGTIEQHFGSD